ncbi:uncharacterized protein LOC142233399 [Haematobia irritans]|uniref:uncharacterized protein LOC142233399 n=1 Tax=Haematobia irritans TaxID=7368 RepID=UPI003F50C06E
MYSLYRSYRHLRYSVVLQCYDVTLDKGYRFRIFDSPTAIHAIELVKRKVLPTYGVSFGLPYPNHPGGYPPNALGDYYPAQNPYFGSIGPNGLNLGLINVNPLVSVQVQKTEFGDKVVKPLVNLHVTPNANIFQKFSNIFKGKGGVIENHHYHHHNHYTGFDHDHHHDYHPEILSDHYSSHPIGGDYSNYHQPEIVTGPGPIHHYSSPHSSYKHYDVEMYPSKPVFEYHSGPQSVHPIPSPLDHHEHHEHSEHYEEHHSSHGSFSSHSSSSYPASGPDAGHSSPYIPGTGAGPISPESHSYPPSTGPDPTSFGSHSSSYPPSAGGSYIPSGQGAPNTYPPVDQFQGYSTGYGATGGDNGNIYDRSYTGNNSLIFTDTHRNRKGKQLQYLQNTHIVPPTQAPGAAEGSDYVTFPKDRKRRSVDDHEHVGEERSSVLAETVKLEQVLNEGKIIKAHTHRIFLTTFL